MHLAARWRAARKDGPALSVFTVDHGLRPGARDEALMVGHAAALSLPHTILAWKNQGDVTTGVQASADGALRPDDGGGGRARHRRARHRPSSGRSGRDLLDAAEARQRPRWSRRHGRDGGLGPLPLLRPLLDVPKARLVASAEVAGLAFAVDPSNADPRFERARLRGANDAYAKLGLTPEALALSARRLRRARAALDEAAQELLSRHAETSDAGYAVVDWTALATCPEEIALRSLSRLLASVGGSEDPVRLAKLEALFAALREHPDKAHTLGRCRIAPHGEGRLGIFREMRRDGLPVLELHPGEGALWDNRFRVTLGTAAPRTLTVRALGESGWRQLREAEALPDSLPRLAARALPACWRGESLLGLADFRQAPQCSTPCSRHEARLDCQATFLRGPIREPRRDAAAILSR
ncbi:hypothetical protein AUC69_14185 [Methyloceanibacter superfactus]|uniref:tRNA(Ile)-lysidine/2-thiocytidine synthase N-terminal domain-containing protein n=1 Tax=Methyloceanibacter superfactus TaxID=1774969 RepID=A0A1E3VTA7_9HYPH|nr:ATP-binding protein [Methyloceanibacter superfactus]ODR96735.1 hypothetical protein AUC69_14185 [Methyloceanibacter superfactus]